MASLSQTGYSPSLLFERHDALRSRQPCATLLVGPVGLSIREWRNWFDHLGRSTLLVERPSLAELCESWVGRLAAEHDLTHAAAEWLAAHTQREPQEILARLAGMSHFDLNRWFSNLALDSGSNPTISIVRRLLGERIEGEAMPPDRCLSVLREAVSNALEMDAPLLRGLSGFVSETAWPTLLFVPPNGSPPDWLEDAAKCCERVVRFVPSLPVAVCCDRATAERVLRVSNPRRELAWLREGWLETPALDRAAIRERVSGTLPTSTLDRLERDGVSESLAEKLDLTTRAISEPASEEAENRARSFAESFLIERLESLPETAGLFRLNHRLDFKHGHKLAEADLVSTELKLVVELDGGYYHLNPTSYRRDRRKDWEYQRRGYWVLRFLSEEVVSGMEEMLDRILDAVRERRVGIATRGNEA